jgi:dTDP-4-dehydrorhamnose 3,5-epimerase
MIVRSTPLPDVFLISIDPKTDARGSFARTFCTEEFKKHGLETQFVQANISKNIHAGTVRGLHFQNDPHAEVKLVSCIVGSIYDVIVDIRKNSVTYLQWFGAKLSANNGLMMYVPQGFAHGYQALKDGAGVHYLVSAFYAPSSEGGLRYNDPEIGIQWPLPVAHVSAKDANWPFITNRMKRDG